jgi:hypothetical protein
MVLKVVRGKILETLELCASQGPAAPFWIWSDYSLEWPESCVRGQVVKDQILSYR